jgi:3-isopropylmalate/(R)-2-methylmalate dehydratase large subunit
MAATMGMTMVEKIMASHLGVKRVSPGDLIDVPVDMVMANDITAPIAIREFGLIGVEGVFDPQRVVMVASHFVPNKDIKAAEQAQIMRAFARKQGIIYFEVGSGGIEHVILPERGLVVPGDVVVGADSHTCTYGALGALATGMGSTDIAAAMASGEIWMKVPATRKMVYKGERRPYVQSKDMILNTIGRIGVDGALYMALEFSGPAITSLSMEARLTMSNMAIEAGAKAGLMPVDDVTLDYVRPRAKRPWRVFAADPDATYVDVQEFDVSAMEPMVACPSSPANIKAVSAVTDVVLDQVVIGSCTNGRIEDLRLAAAVLRGRHVHSYVRCIILPGSVLVQMQALREGLIEVFLEAGAAVSTPTCGPCIGGHMGVLAPNEVCVSTTNRNFVGRMGHPASQVYLANPSVAAASAVLGHIASPEELR